MATDKNDATDKGTTEEDLLKLLSGPLYHTSEGWRQAELMEAQASLARAFDIIKSVMQDISLGGATKFKLMDKGQLLLTVRALRHLADTIRKLTTSPEASLELAMCKEIAAMDLYQVSSTHFTFTARATCYLSRVPKPETPEYAVLQTWLLAHGFGELFDNRLNTKGLEAVVRKMLEEGQEPPPGVDIYTRATVGVRRKKS